MSLYEYQAIYQRTIDGDTIEASVDLGFFIYRRDIFRLRGINTPELNSKDPEERVRAQRAKNFLAEILQNNALFTIKTHKDQGDKYGRMLADIYLNDGTFVNALMIEEGHAVPYMV